jgi:hypothetical protein
MVMITVTDYMNILGEHCSSSVIHLNAAKTDDTHEEENKYVTTPLSAHQVSL